MKAINRNIIKVGTRTKVNKSVRNLVGLQQKESVKKVKPNSARTTTDGKPVKVKSSNIKEVSYDLKLKMLSVTFHAGPTYTYFKVPATRFRGLVDAVSVGEYFQKFVRFKYAYKKN